MQGLRQGQRRRRGQVVRIALHNRMRDGLRPQARRQALEQLLRHKGNRGAAIGDVVLEFRREAHGIGRHHDCTCAQDGVIGNDILRTILRKQEDAVAMRDLAPLLQVAGHGIDFALALAIADYAIVEHDRGLIRITCRRDGKIVVERGGGRVQVPGRAFRPETVKGA